MRYLLGIDIGTSGTKAALFDENGRRVAAAVEEYPMLQPQNGWAEQRPEDWWRASCNTVRTVIAESSVNPADIKGVGLAGQMHGLVMLDAQDAVIRNSIIWCDGRTGEECREITETIGRERLIEITANPALTGFTAGKILWVRRHEPENYERCRHILLPKDYIRFMLTGEYATDVSDASGMNLLDVPKRQWSQEVLAKLGIDEALLGKLYESAEVSGHVHEKAAELTGLLPGTPVVGGAGDNAAAAIGTGVVCSGTAFTTLGSSGVIFTHTDHVAIDPAGRVHSFCSAVPGAWTVMSCTLAAGMSLQWFRNNFCAAEIETARHMGLDPYVLMDQEAAGVAIGAEHLLFLPYLMGERSPLLDENARGAFLGLSGIHSKAHMLRAVMEGVAYSQRQCLDIIKGMGMGFDKMMACGGGARSPLWRQMLADLYGCSVYTSRASDEGPALGAAILAGVGSGVYASVQQACGSIISEDNACTPNAAASEAYEPYYRLYSSAYPALKSLYSELSQL